MREDVVWINMHNLRGCEVTWALKKDVHASVDEHICTPASAPLYLCVFGFVCLHAWTPVCGIDGKVKWTEPRFVAAGLGTLRLRKRTQLTANSFRNQTVKINQTQSKGKEKQANRKIKLKSSKMWRLRKTHSSVFLSCSQLSQPTHRLNTYSCFQWQKLNSLWPFHNPNLWKLVRIFLSDLSLYLSYINML